MTDTSNTDQILDYYGGDILATQVFIDKYQSESNETPSDMAVRMAEEFARIEDNYIQKYELDKITSCKSQKLLSKKGQKTVDKYREWFCKDKESVIENLFNHYFELFNTQKVVPQGSIMSTLGTPNRASLSNCFFCKKMEDNIEDIFNVVRTMAEIGKRRGGTATDLSGLRPRGSEIHNSAKKSSGAVEFLNLVDTVGKIIGQNNRRMAIMVTMEVNHPDILEFIKIKEDLSKVTNANLSVKLTTDFLNSVQEDKDFYLKFPCDTNLENLDLNLKNLEYNKLIYFKDHNLYIKKVKAKDIWNSIIESAHKSAEPGVLFWDNILENSPDGVYPEYKPEGTNPCSEITLSQFDSCRLMVLNLYKFVDNPFTQQATFNFKAFEESVYDAMILSDNLVDLEVEYVQRIIDKLNNNTPQEKALWEEIKKVGLSGRRVGLGFTALADTLAALNLKYGSQESLEEIEKIMYSKLRTELECTIDLSIIKGSFVEYDPQKEFGINFENPQNNFYKFLKEIFPQEISRMLKYGRRNLSWSTVSPTGSVSILTRTSSGIEPLFKPYYVRRKKVSDSSVKPDFIDNLGIGYTEHLVVHPKLQEYIRIKHNLNVEDIGLEGLKALYKESPYYNCCAEDLNWEDRVKVQSLIQKYTTHSISSTVNLPENTTVEEVSNIYLQAFKFGCKGITVYRDGSRSGVLVKAEKPKEDVFEQKDAIKRPKILSCDVYHTKIKKQDANIYIGLLQGKPYEVFISNGNIIKETCSGNITKKSKGNFVFTDSENKIIPINISENMTDEQAAITRLISTSLRHGANIKFIVEQLNKCEGEIYSFTKVLARFLKKYIPEGEQSTLCCPNCNSTNYVYESGCSVCRDCGYSKCN